MHVCSDATQPVLHPPGPLDFMHWTLSIALPNASIRSRKNIVKSAFSPLTYSKTAARHENVPNSGANATKFFTLATKS